MKVKSLGQVFTPKEIVNDILDVSNYNGEDILGKHIIDNSCGDGAFLTEIVDRYIQAYFNKNKKYEGIEKELEKYIHGIEIDTEIYERCIKNLEEKCRKYKLEKVKFDILNEDALKVEKYNNKMDFVVGNPPYVRVHNLKEKYESVKKFSFCENGMTDLYIVFYEIGLKMLKKTGTMCYITPNSFYSSLAGNKLREYIRKTKKMELLMDLGHYQPFSVTTYTTICKIVKNKEFEKCKYSKYNIKTGKPEYITDILYKDLFVNNNIVLSDNNEKYFKYLNYNLKSEQPVIVKNGFATLNDKIFIKEDFDFDENTINIIKASTGEWKKCIYPYNKDGKLIPFNQLNNKTQKYLKNNKKELNKRDLDKKTEWYAFGRSQAINDVKYDKISINTCIKDLQSIKLNKIKSNEGIYSGLYMLTKIPYKKIKEKICSEDFMQYLKVLNKCKSGGYYTFSSKDLAKYINCSMKENS